MATTYEDILALFRENDGQIKELVRSQQDTERLLKERSLDTDRKFQDTDRKFQDTDRKFQDTDRLLKERALETDRKFQETDRLLKERALETDRKFQETDRLVKNLSKNLGELGNRLGEFVEHMVAPAVVRLFQELGIDVHEVHPGVEANRNGEGLEIDLLVVNEGVLIAVECKSKLTLEQVDEHVGRMDKLKRLLPSYRHHRALGAVAAMVVSDRVQRYAIEQGFYVLCQSGEQIVISNPDGFSPRAW